MPPTEGREGMKARFGPRTAGSPLSQRGDWPNSSAMASENRRELRYRAQLVTTLTVGHDTREIVTDDVSFRGAFILTDLVLGARRLVRVSFLLPDQQDVSGHAMVVHVQPSGEDGTGSARQSGIGIEFFGEISGRKRWDAFIQELTRDPTLKVLRAREVRRSPGT